MKNKTKIIILCAGLGSRLKPHTNDLPKSLVEISHKSLLLRQLDVINKFELEIVLIGGYKSEMLINIANNLIINHEYQSTNMLWSLFKAKHLLEGNVIISYGDIVYSPNILRTLIEDDSPISIPIDLNWLNYWKTRNIDILSDAETLRYDNHNNLLEIGNKPLNIANIQGQYMGLIKLNNEGCNIFKDNFESKVNGILNIGVPFKKAYLTDFLQDLILQSINIKVIPHMEKWVEIDTNDDLISAENRYRVNYIESEL